MLKFKVKNQIITRTDDFCVVADSKNYLTAEFEFSEEWNKNIIAIFGYKDNFFHVEVKENQVTVPWEVIKSPYFSVSLFCGDLITANEIRVKVIGSGLKNGEFPSLPTPTVFQQIFDTEKELASEVEKLNETIATKANTEDIPKTLNDLSMEWQETKGNHTTSKDTSFENLLTFDEFNAFIDGLNVGFYNLSYTVHSTAEGTGSAANHATYNLFIIKDRKFSYLQYDNINYKNKIYQRIDAEEWVAITNPDLAEGIEAWIELVGEEVNKKASKSEVETLQTEVATKPGTVGTNKGAIINSDGENSSTGEYGISGGYNSKANGYCSFSVGKNNRTESNCAIAMGGSNEATGLGSIALGSGNNPYHMFSATIGENLTTSDTNHIVVGKNNEGAAQGALFTVGNGSDKDHRSNALHLDNKGNMTIQGTLTALGGIVKDSTLTYEQLAWDTNSKYYLEQGCMYYIYCPTKIVLYANDGSIMTDTEGKEVSNTTNKLLMMPGNLYDGYYINLAAGYNSFISMSSCTFKTEKDKPPYIMRASGDNLTPIYKIKL